MAFAMLLGFLYCDSFDSCGLKLQDLLVATARGSFALREFLRLERSKALLSARDEFGFSSLTVAAYNGALTMVSAC
jgi:hypothetical protein